MKVGSPSGVSAPMRRDPESSRKFLSLPAPTGDNVGTHREGGRAIRLPTKKGALPRAWPCGTLTSDFPPPDFGKRTFLLRKPRSLR